MLKRKRISADQALQNILQFVYENSDKEESDMDELYAEEDLEKHRLKGESIEKKELTYTRNVRSIDTALCEENYDLLPITTKEKIIKGELPADPPSEKNKGKKTVSNNKKYKK